MRGFRTGHPPRGREDYHRWVVARVGTDGFDRLYETARALGEETRFRIYRRIRQGDGPVGVTELAEDFSLHPNAVRAHLTRLEQAGLVVSRPDRLGGAGRPRLLYELSPTPPSLAGPPASLRALVSLLAEAVDTLPANRRKLVEIGRSWGRTWGTRRKRSSGAPRSRLGRARMLERELAEWGWRPTAVAAEGRLRIRTERCLFHDRAAGDHGRCCALEEGLLRGLTESALNGQADLADVRGCRLELTL